MDYEDQNWEQLSARETAQLWVFAVCILTACGFILGYAFKSKVERIVDGDSAPKSLSKVASGGCDD